jgi:hypothetical protein
MTEERTTEKPKIENLELNKETVADLSEEHAENVAGGMAAIDSCYETCMHTHQTLCAKC